MFDYIAKFYDLVIRITKDIHAIREELVMIRALLDEIKYNCRAR